jgi:hypothetical protein
MISTGNHEELKKYLLWAATLRLGIHCKTTTELAELFTFGRNQSSINFIGLNIAQVGRKMNLEFCPSKDPNCDWFAQHWPFIAQQPDYRIYP